MDLGTLIARIEDLAQAPHEIAERAAEKLAGVVREEFAAGVDPRGSTWKPLKRSGQPSHLTRSWDMRKSVHVVPVGTTIEFTIDAPANFHQRGTSKMDARPILPEEGQELPAAYRTAIDDAAREVIAEMSRRALAA